MRSFIHIPCALLIVLLIACKPTLTNPYEEFFKLWSLDSIKYASQTQKMNEREKMEAYFQIGVRYNVCSEFDSARLYLHKAVEMPGGREYQAGRALMNIANSYGFQGRYTEALPYYMEALHIAEQHIISNKEELRTHGRLSIVRTKANLSEIYYLMGNQKQAIYYAEEARKMNEYIGLNYITPQYLYIIGSIYLEKGDWAEAEKTMCMTFEAADSLLSIFLQNDGKPAGMYMYTAYGQEGMAQVALARQDYTGALEHANIALDHAEKHGDPAITAKVLSTFSDIYLAQGDFEESGRYALEAIELYPDYPKLNPGVLFNAAVANMFAGDKEKAYRDFRRYSAQMKKNNDKHFRETMAGMEIVYETEKKETRISALELQRTLFITIGTAILLLTATIGILLWQKMKNERQEKQLVIANAVMEWEKKERKRFASDLHDGINGMLSAVKIQLNAKNNPHHIRRQLDECIDTIRRMARGMMPSSLERYGLKAALEDYCRLFPNVDFHFYGEEQRCGEKFELMLYYCAYELVNNSFRHSGAENIHVQLVNDENYISLTVQDDGCGFDVTSVAQCSGLENIRSRVTAFNGKMDIVSSPGEGTETNIELKTDMNNCV